MRESQLKLMEELAQIKYRQQAMLLERNSRLLSSISLWTRTSHSQALKRWSISNSPHSQGLFISRIQVKEEYWVRHKILKMIMPSLSMKSTANRCKPCQEGLANLRWNNISKTWSRVMRTSLKLRDLGQLAILLSYSHTMRLSNTKMTSN